MGQIQLNTGLATGFPIVDTVDQLMELEAAPRDHLKKRTEKLQEEQAAITELSALMMTSNYMMQNLGKKEVFDRREVFSSNEDVLTARVTGDVPQGRFTFTPVQMAQNHQLLAQGIQSDKVPLGGGEVKFRFGDDLSSAFNLDNINGGVGFKRGMIRITDRSGSRAVIDLTRAQSLDDVISAINNNYEINVTAQAEGDRLVLVDQSGFGDTNLLVQEVNNGTTAASLGLNEIDSSEDIAFGKDLMMMSEMTKLSALNDGNGVTVNKVLTDLKFTLADGTTGVIDFGAVEPLTPEQIEAISNGESIERTKTKQTTVGELIDVINAVEPEKLQAKIGPDGKRLVIEDLTTGEDTFKLENSSNTQTLQSLQLAAEGQDEVTGTDGSVTGGRLIGGLDSVLLSTLNGGSGLSLEAGTINVTDRAGNSTTVDLSNVGQMETLDHLMQAFNGQFYEDGVKVRLQLNSSKTGLALVDQSNGYASNLIVEDATGNIAETLGLEVDGVTNHVRGDDLHLKVVSWQTKLADLRGGQGVDTTGRIQITDSSGRSDMLMLNKEDYQTIGDVIQGINRLSTNVYAEINDNGDGIKLTDNADGEGPLVVMDDGLSTAAADLHLTRSPEEVTVEGEEGEDPVTRQVVDGSMTHVVELAEHETLDDLRKKVDSLNAGIDASVYVDGSDAPFRLAFQSEISGSDGHMVVDMSGLGMEVEETTEAKDSLVVLGDPTNPTSVLLSSSTNTIRNAVPGITLDIKNLSGNPVNVWTERSNADIKASLKAFTENYNKFRKKLDEYTYYDPDTDTRSVLTGDSTALRLDQDLSFFLTKSFPGLGEIQSLMDLGIDFSDTGKITFNEDEFDRLYQRSPDAIEEFFTKEKEIGGETKKVGFVEKFTEVSEALVGKDVSVSASRYKTLKRQIENNTDRIEWLNEQLESKRMRLLTNFYKMELAVSQMQSDASYVNSIQGMAPKSGGGGAAMLGM